MKIVNKMYNEDAFSQWLGIEILDVSAGFCELKLKVTKEMLSLANDAEINIEEYPKIYETDFSLLDILTLPSNIKLIELE